MKRTLSSPTRGKYNPNVRPIRHGGTSAKTALQAAINLGALTVTPPSTPSGLVTLGSDNLIPPELFVGIQMSGLSVSGPKNLLTNSTEVYTITDYDCQLTYTVEAVAGTVVRNKDVITYTAPAEVGMTGFKLNGKLIALSVNDQMVATPSIINPANNATLSSGRVVLKTSAFSVLQSKTDTHLSTDWELASDSAFTQIVKKTTDDEVNLITWSPLDLSPGIKYYVRARHRGATYGHSAWSTTVGFTTREAVNPSMLETSFAVGSSLAGDQFGYSVSLSADGSVAVVGARFVDAVAAPNSGAIYVFTRTDTGWNAGIRLLSTDGDDDSAFGSSVCVSGNGRTIVAGSPGHADGRGAVYVFEMTDTGWDNGTKVFDVYGAVGSLYGQAVSISLDGTSLVVGSPGFSTNKGKLYIYNKQSFGWNLLTTYVIDGGVSGDRLGESVSINASGTLIAAGVPGQTTGRGSVRLLELADGVWVFRNSISHEDIRENDAFGFSVSLSDDGNTLVVGAPNSNLFTPETDTTPETITVTKIGVVYVYRKMGSGWVFYRKLKQATDVADTLFGYSVSCSYDGSGIAIGAPGVNSARGGCLIAVRSGVGYNVPYLLSPASTVAGALCGSSVSISNDGSLALFGAYANTVSSKAAQGSAFLYN